MGQARAKVDGAATGEEVEDLEDEVLSIQADLDKCILRLIAAACKGQLQQYEEFAVVLSYIRLQ